MNETYIKYRLNKPEIPLSFWKALKQANQMKQNYKLDLYTFGGKGAPANLASILKEQYPNLIRKVSRRLHLANREFKRIILGVIELDLRKKVLTTEYRRHVKDIKAYGLPTVVETHMLCTLHGQFSKYRNTKVILEVNSVNDKEVQIQFKIKE
jgi:hypothetical protein